MTQRIKKQYRVAIFIESTRIYSRELIRGIAQYNRENLNWNIEFTPCSLNEPFPEWISDWQGDGILARINNKRLFHILLRKKIPVIDLRRSFTVPQIPQIGTDDQTAITILYDFFRSRGFQRFAFVGIPRHQHPPMDVRRNVCRKIVTENNQTFSELEIDHYGFESPSNQDTRKLTQWIKNLPQHTAVISCNDDMALQVLNICRKTNRIVPNDLAVAGIGNDDCLCELAMPTLTSIDLNPKRIGYEAAEMLQKMMRSDFSPPPVTFIKPNFIVSRMSTNIIATEDTIVNQALQLIGNRACDGLQVKDVLRHVHRSRMTLENRFKNIFGHTIFQEILNVRLQRVKELLSATDLTIKEIARLSGFSYSEHLMRVFHERFGQTMNDFRKDYRTK
ncbi:MAG: DNA-binding transcriptional regulator [Planctomycetaceae bacterium]|jgi:LacI family transcriptional regulator|nr:DNA-binding transcriptional regulator [Planctomycetaceae bacterium]